MAPAWQQPCPSASTFMPTYSGKVNSELHSHNMQVASPAACVFHNAPGACMAWCQAIFMLLLPTVYHALMATATANMLPQGSAYLEGQAWPFLRPAA